MVKTKPFCPHEVNESNKLTKNEVEASNTKRFRGKKTRTKTQGRELEAKTNLKGHYNDLEIYTFDLGPIASKTFSRTMKDLERYLGAAYSNSCQPSIVTKTPKPSPPQICKH